MALQSQHSFHLTHHIADHHNQQRQSVFLALCQSATPSPVSKANLKHLTEKFPPRSTSHILHRTEISTMSASEMEFSGSSARSSPKPPDLAGVLAMAGVHQLTRT